MDGNMAAPMEAGHHSDHDESCEASFDSSDNGQFSSSDEIVCRDTILSRVKAELSTCGAYEGENQKLSHEDSGEKDNDQTTSFDGSVFPGGSRSELRCKIGSEFDSSTKAWKEEVPNDLDVSNGGEGTSEYYPTSFSGVAVETHSVFQMVKSEQVDGLGLIGSQSLINKEMKERKGKVFECSLCGKTFSKSSLLRRHMVIHTGEKPFECSICDKAFSRSYVLQEHMSTHTGEKEVWCDTCGQAFANPSRLKKHINRMHLREKNVECPTCHKKFFDGNDLKKHIQSHSEEKSFECSVCGRTFSRRPTLLAHIQTHSNQNPMIKISYTNTNPNTSKYRKDEKQQKSFECLICGQTFSKSSTVRRHMVGHTGEKPHECEKCGKSFTRRLSLQRHILSSHSGTTKPYNCSTCDKAFSDHFQLQSHVNRIHRKGKHLACSICDKRFYGPTDLERHTRTHSGEKPFECSICQKSFARNFSLRKHIRTHTVEKP